MTVPLPGESALHMGAKNGGGPVNAFQQCINCENQRIENHGYCSFHVFLVHWGIIYLVLTDLFNFGLHKSCFIVTPGFDSREHELTTFLIAEENKFLLNFLQSLLRFSLPFLSHPGWYTRTLSPLGLLNRIW